MKDYIIDKIFIKMQDDIKTADSEYLSAKELIDNLTTIAYEESKLNFYNGFKIGAKLILEILF